MLLSVAVLCFLTVCGEAQIQNANDSTINTTSASSPTQALPGTTTTMATTTTSKPLPVYKITTIIEEPYVMMNPGGRTNDTLFTGYTIDILNRVADLVGFSYVIHLVKDGKYGAPQSHRKQQKPQWSGMVGELIKGDADIAAANLAVTDERGAVIDFTHDFLKSGVKILIKKPEEPTTPIGLVLFSFDVGVWLLLLAVFAAVSGLFFLIGRFSPYEWGQISTERDLRHARYSFNLRNSFLFAFSTLTWQGYREAPKSLSGRVLAAFWWLFTVFVIVAYTANLTALFLVRGPAKPVVPFKTFQQMAHQSDIVYGTLRDSMVAEKLRKSSDPLDHRMYYFMEAKDSYFTKLEDGVKRVQSSDGHFAAIMSSADTSFIVSQNCDVMMVGETLFQRTFAFGCSKGGPICKQMDSALLRLKAEGVLNQLYDKYWKISRKCPDVSEDDYISSSSTARLQARSLKIADVSFGFLILLVGAVLSVVILILEVVIKRCPDKCEKNKPIDEKVQQDVNPELKDVDVQPESKDVKPDSILLEEKINDAPPNDNCEKAPIATQEHAV